jgi:hypothetical protein
MKHHLRLVASNDESAKPPRFNRERLLASLRVLPGALTPFVSWPLRALRHVLYLVMLFLRIPLRVVCRLTVVPFLVVAVIWGFFKGWTSLPVMTLTGSAFALFLVSYLYDTLLMRIAPEPITLDF